MAPSPVDPPGNGWISHSCPIVAYNRANHSIGVQTEGDPGVTWYPFHAVGAGRKFGVQSVFFTVPPGQAKLIGSAGKVWA